MNINEILIAYYINAIAEQRAANEQSIISKQAARIKKVEIPTESIIQQLTPVHILPEAAIVQHTPQLTEDDDMPPIFGMDITDLATRIRVRNLKKRNPAAYENLLNWD